MDRDQRNASRYLIPSANLEFLTKTSLDQARHHAATGDTANVLSFINAVQRQISSEHQEWVLLAETPPDPVG